MSVGALLPIVGLLMLAVLGLVLVLRGGPLRAEEFNRRINAARSANNLAVKQYCLSHVDGTGPKVRAMLARRLSAQLDDSGALARHLDIAFESLAIIERTKSIETLASRHGVAVENLHEAHACNQHAFDLAHRDQLVAAVDKAASGRLAELAIARVQLLREKAETAKTARTRDKHAQAAHAYAEDAAAHPLLSPPDAARVRAVAAVRLQPMPGTA